MESPVLLHIDVTQYGSTPEVAAALAGEFTVHSCRGTDIARRLGHERPFALLFEYDYPDIASLALLREVKGERPNLPIVMVTEQHSEGLALWALRSRVWDYFVKPVDGDPLRQCFTALLRLAQSPAGEETRHLIFPPHPIPAEARFRAPASAHESQLRVVRDLIDNNLHRKITQNEVAREVGMSACHLSRIFKRNFGIGFHEYLLQRRLEQAQRMLRNRSASVADVCWAVGFRDHSYFSRVFRKAFGCSPSEYREKWREGGCQAQLRASA